MNVSIWVQGIVVILTFIEIH